MSSSLERVPFVVRVCTLTYIRIRLLCSKIPLFPVAEFPLVNAMRDFRGILCMECVRQPGQWGCRCYGHIGEDWPHAGRLSAVGQDCCRCTDDWPPP